MRTKLTAVAAAALLALAACSSGSPATTPGDGGGSTPGSDNTPGGDNAPGGDGGTSATNFCEAWDAFQTVSSDEDEDSPDTTDLASLQAWGAQFAPVAQEAIGNLEAAKAFSDDPDVDAAIDTLLVVYRDYFLTMAQDAATAKDLVSFYTSLSDLNTEDIQTALGEMFSAGMTLAMYYDTTCN
jgi:hypothetical protein